MHIWLIISLLGNAEYDYGERFDLKGPYCDSGYVDDDADFGKQVGWSTLPPSCMSLHDCVAWHSSSPIAAASRVLPNASPDMLLARHRAGTRISSSITP